MWGARPVRNIGTRNARRIEIAAGVPAGWLDVEHELDKPSMSTTGVTAFDSRNAFESKAPRAGVLQLRPVEQIADWVTHQIPSVASHSVQLIQDAGSAMATSIPLNSMAVLNTAINSIVDDGIYLLEFSGIRVLRRVALQLDGSLVLTSEARGADPMHVDQGQKQSVHVIGKVVAIISVDPA
jgi:phage repressor protein C with HTH and peptisase S24 domain